MRMLLLFIYWVGSALGWVILGLFVQHDWEQVGPVITGLLDGF